MSAILDMHAPLNVGPYLKITENLADLDNVGTARTNLGLVSGGTGDIWVEKTGDTMTGPLTITYTTPVLTVSASSGSPSIKLLDDADADFFTILFNRGNDDLRISSNTVSPILTIEKTGNIGINGVANPGTALAIGAGAMELSEMTAPVGATNTARLYAVDNGGGKTQLVVIFSSGAAQVLATQP